MGINEEMLPFFVLGKQFWDDLQEEISFLLFSNTAHWDPFPNNSLYKDFVQLLGESRKRQLVSEMTLESRPSWDFRAESLISQMAIKAPLLILATQTNTMVPYPVSKFKSIHRFKSFCLKPGPFEKWSYNATQIHRSIFSTLFPWKDP